MGYCDTTDIETVLNQALTTANPVQGLTGVPADLTSIGNRLKVRLVTTDSANFYIRLADSHINAALSQQYETPLHEVTTFTGRMTIDIDEYSDTIELFDAGDLSVGQYLIVTDGEHLEKVKIQSISETTVTPVTPVSNLYDASSTRILRIQFPDPITFISARLAAAAIYDKYATAQQEPGKTEFGQMLRRQAYEELDNVREGRTILHGIERKGWRFANPNLLDRYTVKGAFEQDSTRSSGQGKA